MSTSMIVVLLLASLLTLCASQNATLRFLLPMRDGVGLNTVVYASNITAVPTMYIRTPYGEEMMESTVPTFMEMGLNVVLQDFRSTGLSQGEWDLLRQNADDSYDTMQWIADQSWSNGDVVVYGVSALGIAAYLQAIDQPPWVKAQGVYAATAQLYDTVFQHGAYRQSLVQNWFYVINQLEYEPVVLSNEQYSTEYWGTVDLTGKWNQVTYPAAHMAGWYDPFLQLQLDTFEAYRTQSNTELRNYNYLVVLPAGDHCEMGGNITWPVADYGANTFNTLMATLFYLTVGPAATRPQARAMLDATPKMLWYVLGPGTDGSIGNYWTVGNDWPTYTNTSYYLSPSSQLSTSAPTASSQSVSYDYDPSNPVTTFGGNNLGDICGPQDQKSFESRNDVITFTTATLTDTVAVTGHLYAVLYVSSNATDTDFTVKITDVFPDGRSMLVQDSIVRMRWREGPAQPVLMTPGQIYEITVDIWSISYIFNVGHAIRVAISSSNNPRFSVNPNNGLMLNQTGPLLIAHNTVHFDSDHPSRLILPVVDIATLPNINATDTTPIETTTSTSTSTSTTNAGSTTTTTSAPASDATTNSVVLCWVLLCILCLLA